MVGRFDIKFGGETRELAGEFLMGMGEGMVNDEVEQISEYL